jgi:hypothetical protein
MTLPNKEKIVTIYFILLLSIRFFISESSYELVEQQNRRKTPLATDEKDTNEILDQGQMYQSNGCWNAVYNDLNRMKDYMALDRSARLPFSSVELREIDSCFFLSRDHRRLLALKITNCHMRDSGRPTLPDSCSSSAVLQRQDPADKLNTCMSKLEWQTYTHFYLSIESICSQLHKESITTKLINLSASTATTEKAFEEKIATALNNLSTLHKNQLGREAKIQKSREDQILAQKLFQSTIDSFHGNLWTSISSPMNQIVNSYGLQRLGHAFWTIRQLIKSIYSSFQSASSASISWKIAAMKFIMAIVFFLLLSFFISMKHSRRRVIILSITQFLVELSLVAFRMHIKDEKVIILWWRWTNICWLVFIILNLLVVPTYLPKTGNQFTQKEFHGSTAGQNDVEKLIELQNRENERVLKTIICLLETTISNQRTGMKHGLDE